MAIDTGLSRVAAVLFDFDGTLYHLDTDLEAWRLKARKILAPSERWRSKVDDIVAATDGPGRDVVLTELAAVEADGLRRGGPIPGAAVVASTLSAHLAVGVVSRNLRPTLDVGLASMGLGHLVSVAREDTRHTKPDPEPFVLAMTRLGVDVDQVVIVGDSSHDVEGARACGARVVVVTNRRLAHRPVGADADIETLAALPALLGRAEGQRPRSRSAV